MNQERKRVVSVEDLLRLKRTEKPAAEFWTRFDRELRTKQLAALVERRSWWNRIPEVFVGMRRLRLPVGAMAVLALSFVAARQYQPETAERVANAPTAMASVPTVVVEAEGGNVGSSGGLLADAFVLPIYDVRDSSVEAGPVEVAADAGVDSTEHLSRRISLLDPISDLQSADRIAANLAAAQAAEPVITRSLLGAARGFETRALPARAAAVDPLAQMTHPSEARRARIQSAMVSMAAPEVPARTGARTASRISDERLYEQPQRLNGRGDRFSIKF